MSGCLISAADSITSAQFNRLIELVEMGQVRRIIIAHRDRLVRFGFDFFETFAQWLRRDTNSSVEREALA